MKHKNLSRKLILSLSALLLAYLLPAAHAAECSTVKAAGNWSWTLTGTLILPTGPVPATATGRFTADIEGNLAGTEARSVGGDYADETLKGKMIVNPDCTGSLTANIYQSGALVRTSVLSLAMDEGSKEIRAVQKSLTLPDGSQVPVVIIVEGKKQ